MTWRDDVLQRDGGCVAPIVDPDAGPCRGRWGDVTASQLEADYVRMGSTGARHELASDHVALCPGHHRGTGASAGVIWATAHRADLRAYLDRKAAA